MKLHFQRDLDAARREATRLQERQPLLRQRAAILRALRNHLDEMDFLEVSTPVRLPCPALEDYIEAEPAGRQWLRTSPELHMKRLLAAGYPKIYQIGPCFRRGECGRRHQPEFTMLEWYRLHGDWIQLQQDVIGLLRAAAMAAGSRTSTFRGETVDFFAEWEQISVTEAFQRYAGVELAQALADERFEQILVEQVEPHLGHRRPTFLTHYPLACSGLSKPLPEHPDLVERWELYVGGLELANACSELIDPAEQERRFQKSADLRSCEKRPVYPMDQDFMDALWMGMPEAAGVAVGIDRLVMVLTGAETIADVIAFPVDYCG